MRATIVSLYFLYEELWKKRWRSSFFGKYEKSLENWRVDASNVSVES